MAGRPVQPDRRLQDRLLAVDRRRADLEPRDSDRPVAGQHAGLRPPDPCCIGGTIGLLYYDLENATAAQAGLTDAFIAHCHSSTSDCSNPTSWAAGGETRLSTSGSFNYLTAPQAGGLFLGDYDGLTSSGTTFKAFFGMSQPIATSGRSDTISNSAH